MLRLEYTNARRLNVQYVASLASGKDFPFKCTIPLYCIIGNWSMAPFQKKENVSQVFYPM